MDEPGGLRSPDEDSPEFHRLSFLIQYQVPPQIGHCMLSGRSIRCIVGPFMNRLLRILPLLLPVLAGASPVLDKRQLLERQDFWINRDFEWFEQHIPFIDSPDKELDTSYYYRWELVTRHIVYANPETGYVFTEFANRPFWSGAYGTISCPAGMQIDDIRWLRDPRFARDYMRFWMQHPGAQARNYSFWAAESAWSIHEVAPHPDFIQDLFPELVRNFEAWEKRSWVEEIGLFWQFGHDDGMEFDINAQQTKDILRGGQSLRPSFNTYMWADAKALAEIARLADNPALADRFGKRAADIKARVQEKLWDPSRAFFFPMSNQRHEKQGHVIEKHSLTYQTGQFAGSPHGRELHGYVPWAFNMPDPGFEDAWQFLMDDQFFKAPFGPTTVERNDPLFVLKDGCCWWSGQSWPFATAQTLKGMANLLQNYSQKHVDHDDYAELLHTFAISHRKDGKPYIAEALNPFTGSWKGHDMENRSEHYFHSGFTDLIITGLAGIQPAVSDTLTIKPLIPPSWDYFAIDSIPYHGHLVSVVWDRSGNRYGKGKGLQLIINGETAARSDQVATLHAKLPGGSRIIPIDENPPMNYAVNNDGGYYPRYSSSHVGPEGALSMIGDGEYVYDRRPVNRWTTLGSPNDQDWVEVDFGTARPIHQVQLYIIDDGETSTIRAPRKIELQHWNGKTWKAIPQARAQLASPVGGRPHSIHFPAIRTQKLRALLTHQTGSRSALTEIQAWGDAMKPYQSPAPPKGNLAYNPDPANRYPKISASFSDRFGGVPEKAIDGTIIFPSNPNNRWTSYGSPNAESDWLALDFGEQRSIGRAVLHIFDDSGGVRAPKQVIIQHWLDGQWKDIGPVNASPAQAKGGMANTFIFAPVETTQLRFVFRHIGHGDSRSGVTELEVWAE